MTGIQNIDKNGEIGILGREDIMLDENVNTVKSRLYRGLKKLRLELTDAWQWE